MAHKKAAPKKRCRSSKYTKANVDEICGRLSMGESLYAICKDAGMPAHPTVILWANENKDGFADKYTRARNIGLDVVADQVMTIVDNEDGDPQRDRLRFDARRWYLSKLAPKKYGDKTHLEHSGPAGGAIEVHTLDASKLSDVALDELMSARESDKTTKI